MSDAQDVEGQIQRFRRTIDETRRLIAEARAASDQRRREVARMEQETYQIERTPAVAPPPRQSSR